MSIIFRHYKFIMIIMRAVNLRPNHPIIHFTIQTQMIQLLKKFLNHKKWKKNHLKHKIK